MPRRFASAAAGVLSLTALGAGVGLVAPSVAGDVRPHPVLAGTITDAIWILQNNLRVLAIPFLLGLLGLAHSRLGRRTGDVLTLAIAAASAVSVGIELGRWQDRLLPYVVQLPLEWASLAVAITAWLTIRSGSACRQEIAVLAMGTVLLTTGAAAVEAFCTPHRQDPRDIRPARPARFVSSPSLRVPVLAVASDFAPAAAASLQGRTLPSPRAVRFRLATQPALTGLTTTTDPLGGITA